MLRYSHPYLLVWQRVLDNITKHGKEVGSHSNVVSQKNATHILEGPCHKWWGIEERKNREEIDEQNQSGANEFPGTYHEKAWTWEHRSHWENWGREKQRKTTAELHEKPQPAVENQWSRDHRKNKKPRRVENHDRQRPNWIRHLERSLKLNMYNTLARFYRSWSGLWLILPSVLIFKAMNNIPSQ